MLIRCTIIIFVVLLENQSCFSWEADDYEMFDLVEEINKNFYEALNITQDATTSDIRKAFYKLSLKLHPDHNEDPEADKQFRHLVSMYEVLKDDVKREKYDQVLKVGLPNWKNPLYYYRKVRKLGLLEITVILLAIFTVGHYLIMWSVYLERKYEIEEVLSSKLKRRDRKLKKGKQVNDNTCELITERINELSKPSFQNLFPILIVRSFKSLIVSTPLFLEVVKSKYYSYKKVDEESSDNESVQDVKKPKRKRVVELPEYSSQTNVLKEVKSNNDQYCVTEDLESKQFIQNNSKVWSEKDISALTKMMNRYPSGTTNRWEKIANDLNRNVKDVTEIVKTLKSNTERRSVAAELQGITISNLVEITKSEKTLKETCTLHEGTNQFKGNESSTDKLNSACDNSAEDVGNISINDAWNQVQQKALEQAIAKYPRGTEERWERIAECIPNKSKEDCYKRYKHLVEIIKLKKQKK